MRIVRYILFCSLALILVEAAEDEGAKKSAKGCAMKNGVESCTQSEKPKSRKKRTVYLPNQTMLTMQSRLVVPQPPVGVYLVWFRVRFFIRSMFTQSLIPVVGQNNIVAALGRSFSTDDDIGNLLTRTIIDDQIDVLGKIEAAMEKSGIPGKPCVLRAICELTETPIHHWSVFGEMITNLLRPKNGSHVTLEEYKKAEKIGEEQGDCWSFYPECAFSIFNIIPDVYTTDDHVEVTFDGFESGSKFNQTDGKVDEDLMNMIKDEVKIVSEHKVDIDLTT